MKIATRLVLMAALLLAIPPQFVQAEVPEGKIVVVRATAIEGLAGFDGEVAESRSHSYTFRMRKGNITITSFVEILDFVVREKTI